MDHQGRGGDLAEPRPDRRAAVKEPVVGHARLDVGGAVDDPPDQFTQVRLVKPVHPGEGSLALDDVVDHQGAVGPVRRRSILGEEGAQLARHRRQVGIGRPTRTGGACGDQRERGDPIRVLDRQPLADRSAHRDAHNVRAIHGKAVEQAHRIRSQIRNRVRRRPRGVAGRAAGVTAVEADDEPQARRQPRTEPVLPPVHRAAHAADQQDRGIARLTERLHTQAHTVDVDHPIPTHHASALRASPRPISAHCPITLPTPALTTALTTADANLIATSAAVRVDLLPSVSVAARAVGDCPRSTRFPTPLSARWRRT
jgi:hypothetical protein